MIPSAILALIIVVVLIVILIVILVPLLIFIPPQKSTTGTNIKTTSIEVIKKNDEPKDDVVYDENDMTKITCGILIYTYRGKIVNIGDYIQSLAQINGFKRIVENYTKTKIDFKHFLDKIMREGYYENFRFIFLSRDNMSKDAIKYPKIYVIMNGWFLRSVEKDEFDWPPPDNITPLFISFHCYNDVLLDPKYIPYYKKHEPIGCRDLHTKEAFENIGVNAYFSGCMTLTIDFFKWENRNGMTCVIDTNVDKMNIPNQIVHFAHEDTDKDTPYVELFYQAYNLLSQYRMYKNVITSRVHAYLPCIGIGIPVTFVSKNGDVDDIEWMKDKRFGGLIGKNIDYTSIKKNLRQKIDEFGQRIIEENRLHIVFCTDDNYSRIIPTVLNSIFQNNKHNYFAFHIIYNTLSNIPTVKSYFNQYREKVDISFYKHDISSYDYHNDLDYVSIATMLRLFIPQILPLNVTRVLYLDLDVIVQVDLKKVFEYETGETGICARRNNYINDTKRFNAGVLLMDLVTLRQNKFTDICLGNDIPTRFF